MFKYNISHEYYNDICYRYTNQFGTDIILSDRINEYINNNMSLCESNCEYKGYDFEIQKAKCECVIKIKMLLISDIVIDKNKLLKAIDIKNSLNWNIMKCYKVVFSKSGLDNNVGSYIMLSILFITMICLIIFFKKGFYRLKNYINEIYESLKPNNKKK